MRIRLYSESPDPGPGGAEQFVAVLAEALSGAHEIVIAHHKSEASVRDWAEYSGCDLSRVTFRQVTREEDASQDCRTPWARYRAAREWRSEVTGDCDLFVGLLHNKPPFCRARKGVLVVLFPTYRPEAHCDDGRKSSGKKKKRQSTASDGRDFFGSALFRRVYGQWEWRRRIASYEVKLSISSFSQEWARTRWGIETGLLHPPVALPDANASPKIDRILSVGRFATTGHTKKQLELLQVFCELQSDFPGWSYSSLGGLNDTAQDRAYFESACAFRVDNLVEVFANLERQRLQDYFAQSKIFWHAAGLGDDLSAQPEMAEHFGLSTAEAMAHGCVPVVVNLGGQREIVEHGVSGFLWDSLAELKNHTRQLAADPALLANMSLAARHRAVAFSREACVRNLCRYASLDQP